MNGVPVAPLMVSVGVQHPLIQPGRWSSIQTATDCIWERWFCLLLGDLRKFLHISRSASVEMRRCGDHSSHIAQIQKSYRSTSLCANGLCCHTSCFDLSMSLYAVGHYCHSQWSCFIGDSWMSVPTDERKSRTVVLDFPLFPSSSLKYKPGTFSLHNGINLFPQKGGALSHSDNSWLSTLFVSTLHCQM